MGQSLLLIRADADSSIGAGHVSRCLALAQAWQDLGGQAVLLGQVAQDWLSEALREEGMEVVSKPSDGASPSDLDALLVLTSELSPDWIVIDGYRFGHEYIEAVAKSHRTLVIDDAEGPSDVSADMVVNPNPFGSPSMYKNGGTTALTGAGFALLRRPFAYMSHTPRPDSDILTMALGGGNASVTKSAESLGDQLNDSLPGYFRSIQFLNSESRPLEKMRRTKVAITAAGVTAIEFCRLGVPQVLVSKAANQRAMATSLDSAGCGFNGGDLESLHAEDLTHAVRSLVDDQARFTRMRMAGRELVDGQGAARVALSMGAGRLRLQPVQANDSDQLLAWANDPGVRAVSFNSSPIHPAAHSLWLREQLDDPNTLFLMALDAADYRMGQIRFSPRGLDRLEVHVTVDPSRRGQGIGAEMIRTGCRIAVRVLGSADVIARVKSDNAASVGAFAAAGFSEESSENGIVQLTAFSSDIRK